MTMMGSFGGGVFGLLYTMIKNKGKAEVMDLINSVLGSLVSITAGCFLYRAWEAILIGMIGAAIASITGPLFDRIKVDDPVGASAVHGACGFWGVLAVGLFADNPIPMETTNGRSGLFKGGGWYLLGVQALTGVCLMTWATVVTMALLWLIDKIMPIRMDPYEELLGADLTEHRIRHGQVGVSRAVSALRPFHRTNSIEAVDGVGVNSGHTIILDKLSDINNQKAKDGNLKMFTNNAFEDDHGQTGKRKKGILNRASNPANDLHRALDSMVLEMNGAKFRKGTNGECSKTVAPEELKGKKLKELSVNELEDVEEINANMDRFRHRFGEDDYKRDVMRANSNIRWID